MTSLDDPLLHLGRELKRAGYRFTTVTPATHERINRRPANVAAHDLRDVFGWSRQFPTGVLPAAMMELLDAAGATRRWPSLTPARRPPSRPSRSGSPTCA
jgi:hypothetical protein